METEGSNQAKARKGGGKSFAKSFLNCSRKTLGVVLQSFLSGCDRSHPPLWGNFFPDVLYIPSEQEINFLTWIFGIWSLTDFFALGDFLAPFQTYWLQSLLENAPTFTRVNNKFLRGWKNTNCSLMKGWLTPEWAKVKNGFPLEKPFRSGNPRKKVEKTSFCIFPFPKVVANAKKWKRGEISGSFMLFPVKEAKGVKLVLDNGTLKVVYYNHE